MKKQNSVLRLTEKIYSSPQLITKDGFLRIQEYLEARNEGILLSVDDESSYEDQPDFYNAETGVGVLNINGTLTNKPVMTLCGEVGTSYAKLTSQAEEMLAAGVTTVLMNVSSGGGEAYGCFLAANQVRQMANEAGAKIYGYVDGMAASAAYAWLSIADEIYAHPDAETGSIGVVCSLMDTSGYMAKEGLKRVFVTAGKEKVPFDADGSFKKEFLDDLQYKIDAMYENFVNHVAQHTGLSADAIKNTEAKTFMSKDAVALGLIHGIKTESEFQDYVVSQHKGKEMIKLADIMKRFGLAAKDERAEVDLKDTEELQEMLAAFEATEQSLSAALAEVETLKAQMAEFAEAKAQAEANAKQVKMDARLASLSANVGDERAKAVLAATEGLEDAQFEAIASALQKSAEVEAKSSLFTEAGVDTQATPEANKEETLEMKNLKAKYGNK